MRKSRKASFSTIIERLSNLEGSVHEISKTLGALTLALKSNGANTTITKLLVVIFTIITSWLGVITYLITRG